MDDVPKPLSRIYYQVPALASVGLLAWIAHSAPPPPSLLIGFIVLLGVPIIGLARLVGKSEGIAWAHRTASAALASPMKE